MSKFGFEIILTDESSNFTIEPPHSFKILCDIALEKFNLSKADIFCAWPRRKIIYIRFVLLKIPK